MDAQPSGLGGIFDRAVMIYARNFAPFAAIAAVALAPAAVVQYFLALRERPHMDALMREFNHPTAGSVDKIAALFGSPSFLATTTISLLFGYLMLAFAMSAVAAGVGQLYQDHGFGLRSCYRVVLSRALSIVGLFALLEVVLIGAYAVAVVAATIPVAAISLAAPSSVIATLPIALTAVLVGVTFVLLLVVVVGAYGFCAIVVEGRPALEALRCGYASICNRRELGRALLCSLGVSVIAAAGAACVDLVALLGFARWTAAYTALDAAARTLVVPFVAIVLAVYYFDLRNRGDSPTTVEELFERDEQIYAPTRYLSGPERKAIAAFLSRRDSLSPQRRRALAAQLAAPARERVPPELGRLDDEALLERL